MPSHRAAPAIDGEAMYQRIPALVLMVAGLLAMAVMILHPHASGADPQARLQSLATISSLSLHVHLAMIVLLLAQTLALAWVARIWADSGWVWLALRLYVLGACAMLGAALINGFVVAAYLRQAHAGLATPEVVWPAVWLAFAGNQALAGFGTVLMSLAIAGWSMPLLRARGRWTKVCGGYGLLAGPACLLAFAGGWLSLNVTGMTWVVVAQGGWLCLLAACLLVRDTP